MRERKNDRRVFVGNLDYHMTSADIREMFSGYGEVTDVYFPRDHKRLPPILNRERQDNEPINYGCAFIEFKTKEQAKTVFVLDDITDCYDRKIYISTAEKQ